jgi:LacI family repressor for deo operon, udp, cdd, tsx, nupC, and nupG
VAVTLRDVARHAGVSPRTVSNVVNGFDHVSPAMRAKVQAALDELHYEPNLLARSLRQGRTGIINLFVPKIASPYFAELAHEVVELAGRRGYTVLIDETSGSRARELALLGVAARSRWVDGVVLNPVGLDTRALAGLRASSFPIVLLGEHTGPATHDHVGIDNGAAARDAAQHLIDSGRRRIGAVGGDADRPDATSRLRLEGHRSALRAAGLPVEETLYGRAPDYTRGQAASAVRGLLASDDPPDALVCFAAEIATGALHELSAQGVRVPQEISVVTFDDVEECRYASPSLTSVGPEKAEIAEAALGMLVERIAGLEADPRDVQVQHELVVRDSSSSPGSVQGGHVGEQLRAAVEGARGDQLQVKVGPAGEDRLEPGLPGDHGEDRHLQVVDQTRAQQ